MGKSLYEGSSLAKAVYAEADRVLGWSISRVSFEGPEAELTLTRVCQPALYVMGYAIFRILQEEGKLEDLSLAMGLSLGELTALAAAESVDFATGLQVVAERGRLMQEACDQSQGAMASMIGGTQEAVEALCQEHDVDLANLNCPGQMVISGDADKVGNAVQSAKDSGNFKMVVPLKVAGAYHSRLMEPARQAFAEFLSDIDFQSPKITVLSNTHGEKVSSPEEIREALAKQVVSPVRWEDCMRNAAKHGITQYYECGPGAVLTGLGRRIDRSLSIKPLAEYDDLGIA